MGKIPTFLSQNLLAVSLSGLVLFTTISASAMEIAAPKPFKPSSIFSGKENVNRNSGRNVNLVTNTANVNSSSSAVFSSFSTSSKANSSSANFSANSSVSAASIPFSSSFSNSSLNSASSSTFSVNSSAQNSQNFSSQIQNPQNPAPISNSNLAPLMANEQYEVAVLTECDLALRFNKNELSLEKDGNIYVLKNLKPYLGAIQHEETAATIECADKPYGVDRWDGPLNDNPENAQKFLQLTGIPQAKNLVQNLWVQGNSEFTFEYESGSFGKKYYKLFQTLRASQDYKLQFNSLAPSVSSLDLNAIKREKTTCQGQCFAGFVGKQPVLIQLENGQNAGAGSIFRTGTITYTAAGNTPIPIKWQQANSVNCQKPGSEEEYLCRGIVITEMVEGGGELRKDVYYNPRTEQEEASVWLWESMDKKTSLPVTLEQVYSF